jgi:hypothetical protein
MRRLEAWAVQEPEHLGAFDLDAAIPPPHFGRTVHRECRWRRPFRREPTEAACLPGAPDSAIASYEHYLNAAPMWDLDMYKLPFVLEHVAALYGQQGSRRKARVAYERLAEMWKDADPELQPRVKHARERSVALR